MLRALLLLGICAVWAIAMLQWPDLPERLPTHFNGTGQPDRWTDKSVASWFLLPALGALFGIVLGWMLPKFARGMARRNSPLLNMPQQQRFRELPEDARVRAVDAVMNWIVALAVLLQALFGWILYASNEVAHQRWQELPMAGTVGFLVVITVTTVGLAIAGGRAVRREVDAIDLAKAGG